jgi:hypothetical protein
MKHYLSKEAKADIAFRIKVAEKFGIQPVSLRASRLLDKYCESADQVKEWISDRHILKIKQMGKKTIQEILCAFGFCQDKSWHHVHCHLCVKHVTNYREELKNYAQIFRKRINVTQLTKDIMAVDVS